MGDLQPILARVGRAIERVVMTAPAEQAQALAGELGEIEQELDQRDRDILNVYEGSESVHPWAGLAAPITLPELEQCFLESTLFKHRFSPHPDIEKAYRVDIAQGRFAVTFDPEIFDRFPNSLHFLSYGSQVLEALLDQVPPPERDVYLGIARFSSDDGVPLKSYYVLNQEGQPIQLLTLQDLVQAIERTHECRMWTDEALAQAKQDFDGLVQSARKKHAEVTDLLLRAARSALVEQAFQIFLQATLLDLLLNGYFSDVEEAWRTVTASDPSKNLLSHGYPFAALRKLALERERKASAPRLDLDTFRGASSDQLKKRFRDLQEEGKELLGRLGKI